jgi:hypothetical protein
MAHLLVRRIRKLVSHRLDRHDHAGNAVRTLQRALFDERLLDGMKLIAMGQAFDRGYLPVLYVQPQHRAGADRKAVQQHRTRTADLLVAAQFCSG